MKIDTAIAAINDNQSLNSKEVLDLFVDLFNEKPPEELNCEVLKDYLKIQKIDDESPYQEVSKSLLDELTAKKIQFYEDYLEEIEQKGIEFVPFYSEHYPARLWSIADPPLSLYIDGDVSTLSDGVAVVGTREALDHRLEFVEEVAQKLVEMNKVVVSGLANGVDEAAHEGALKAGGDTAAILPGHVEKIRPASNKKLGKEIREKGALVSELSKKKSIHRGRFVERNRITSGISSAVIIGASGETGGTIHQADFAKEQDKPRFLYDPEKDDGQSPDKLLKKGFETFQSVDDLEALLNKKFVPPNGGSTGVLRLDDFN